MLAPGPCTLCSVAGLHRQHKLRLWHHAEARATAGPQSRTVSEGVGAKAVAALIVSIATTAVILACCPSIFQRGLRHAGISPTKFPRSSGIPPARVDAAREGDGQEEGVQGRAHPAPGGVWRVHAPTLVMAGPRKGIGACTLAPAREEKSKEARASGGTIEEASESEGARRRARAVQMQIVCVALMLHACVARPMRTCLSCFTCVMCVCASGERGSWRGSGSGSGGSEGEQ